VVGGKEGEMQQGGRSAHPTTGSGQGRRAMLWRPAASEWMRDGWTWRARAEHRTLWVRALFLLVARSFSRARHVSLLKKEYRTPKPSHPRKRCTKQFHVKQPTPQQPNLVHSLKNDARSADDWSRSFPCERMQMRMKARNWIYFAGCQG